MNWRSWFGGAQRVQQTQATAEPERSDWLRGVRVSGWLDAEPELAVPKGSTGRIQGKRYPVQARTKGNDLCVRANATLSTEKGGFAKGARRDYLEREEALPYVMQDAAIEDWPERWSIWLNPSEHVSSDVAARVLAETLHERHGVKREDLYIVEHTHLPEDGDRLPRVHLHAVVRGREGLELSRSAMHGIGREIVKELVLERQLDRAMEPDL